MKSLRNILKMSGELRKLKKYAPEITSTIQYFDQDKNPKKVLEKIINTARDNPGLDNFLKVSKTYDMILRGEKRAKDEEKGGWNYACREAVKEMGVNYEIRGAENIPKNGGALYIINHPYGLMDAIMLMGGLGSLLSKKGRKLKVIAMNQLRFVKGIEEIVNFVHSTVKGPNMGSLKESLRYVKNGGDLAIFPSGRMSKAGLEEYPWKNLRIFLTYSSNVVPMWFSGPDHAKIYNFLAKNKRTEKLRRVFSLREIWDKEGETVILNIGKAKSSEELREKRGNGEIVKELREEAEALKVAV